MSNNRKEDFENVLQDPELAVALDVDELAVHNSGLTHPNDLELERILAEDWDSVPDHEEPVLTPEEALNRFLYEEDDAPFQEETYPAEAPTQVIPVPAEAEPSGVHSLHAHHLRGVCAGVYARVSADSKDLLCLSSHVRMMRTKADKSPPMAHRVRQKRTRHNVVIIWRASTPNMRLLPHTSALRK